MMFCGSVTNQVILYVKDKYGGEPEFLWAKTPENAVFRHGGTSRWYGAILSVQRQKLGIEGDGVVEILDLKCDPTLIGSLRDGKTYLPAYHMNKEHWITILLDESARLEEVYSLIDLSYNMTK